MARRESQGLQIALIVFVMVTVLLAVLTYMFWNQAKTRASRIAALEDEISSAKTTATEATYTAEELKKMIGLPEADLEGVRQQYTKDMATYAGSLPEEERTYTEVPRHLLATLQERNQRIADLSSQISQLNNDLQETRQNMQARIEELNGTLAQTQADLLKAQSDFSTATRRLEQEKQNLANLVDQTRQERDQLEAQTTQEIARLNNEVRNKNAIIGIRDEKIRTYETTSFESPDGRVTWVNPKTGVAYINLGRNDGLRRQVTFSVYGMDVNNLVREQPKGKLEVTRIVNDSMAEARITNESLSDPILAGDVIFTPLWNSQSALHFALAGFMDVNGDGQDDREMIKNLITMHGGTIDAEQTGGEVKGEITNHTRYLIQGDPPKMGTESSNGEAASSNQDLQQAWTTITRQADRHGVEVLSIEKLIDLMGFDGSKRTIPLGKRARPEDFSPEAVDRARRSRNDANESPRTLPLRF